MGRLIEKNSPTTKTTYTYDAEGYLVTYSRHTTSPVILGLDPGIHPKKEELDSRLRGNDEKVTIHFTYDPLGRRLTKHYKEIPVIPYPDTESSSTKESEYHHRYLYDEANIIAIYDADTDTLLATLLHDEGIDTPLSIHIHPTHSLSHEEQQHYESLSEDKQFLFNQSKIKHYYYHRDHQNSIIALSDDNAQIIEYYEYDAYGNITKADVIQDDEGKTIQTLNPYRYTGREYDTDDLYYYRARYYDPTIGRFITPDPIGFLAGDTNFYRYVGNDPVNFVDPSGLACEGAIAAGGTLGAGAGAVFGGGVSLVCDAYTGGACVAVNAPVLAATTGGGAVGGAALGKGACVLGQAMGDSLSDAYNWISQKVSTNTSAVRNTKTGVKSKSEDVKCGERGQYNEKKNAKDTESGDMNRDHIPNTAYMLERLKQSKAFGILSKTVQECIKKNIKNHRETLGVPESLHEVGRSYKSKGGEIAKNEKNIAPQTVQGSDLDEYERLLDDDQSKLTEKEKKAVNSIDKDCKDAIKKAIKEMREEDPQTFIDKMIEQGCTKAQTASSKIKKP
jgi:RHS repeat-associated protein